MQTPDRERRFQELVARHRDIIWHVCSDYHSGLNRAWEVEDAFQEVLCIRWRDMDDFAGRSSERTWVYRVATTTMLMLRRQARNQMHDETSEQPEQALPAMDNYDLLLQLIDNLDEVDSQIVHAHLDGYSLHETAHMTGLTTAAVAMRLSRAKKRLRKRYDEIK